MTRLAAGWGAVPMAAVLLASDLGAVKTVGAAMVAAWVVLVLAPWMTQALVQASPDNHRTPAPELESTWRRGP